METVKMTVKVEGFDHLFKAFSELGDEAQPYLKNSINAAAELIAEKARSKVPVKSGRLKDSIKVVKAKASSKRGATAAYVTVSGDYAAAVELGHKVVSKGGDTIGTVKAKPFLRSAYEEAKEAAFYTIVDGINEALEKYGIIG